MTSPRRSRHRSRRDVSDVTTTSVAGSGTGTGIGDAAGPTSLPAPPPLTYTIAWEPVDDRTDVGTITVPVDYDDPQGATLDLRVARHQADPDHRIGVLATNNGGPGSAASSMALNAASWFPSEITDQFDIVSWDPAAPARRAPRWTASTTPNSTGSSASRTSRPMTRRSGR